MGRRIMKNKSTAGALTFCAFTTTLGWWAIKNSWVISFLTGPFQHLGLAAKQSNNANEYIDGISRVGVAEYFIASLQIALWAFSVALVIYYCKGTMQVTIKVLAVLGWGLIGMLNVYLFAIRSV
jgi:hypothetical protein